MFCSSKLHELSMCTTAVQSLNGVGAKPEVAMVHRKHSQQQCIFTSHEQAAKRFVGLEDR
jgi:hypothetical protein